MRPVSRHPLTLPLPLQFVGGAGELRDKPTPEFDQFGKHLQVPACQFGAAIKIGLIRFFDQLILEE